MYLISTILSFVLIFGFSSQTTLADAPSNDCTLGDVCYRVSRSLLRCNNYGDRSPELPKCVCGLDPTWDRDILECQMCWAREAGSAYQDSVAAKYEGLISCGPSPVAACDDTCRAAWQVGNTCGGYLADQKECICGYYYVWEPTVESIRNCTGCLYDKGETALADTLRGWYDWRCELSNGYISPLPSQAVKAMPGFALAMALFCAHFY